MIKQITLVVILLSASVHADYLYCPCKVVKVSDGDTVHILDQSKTKYKIRLGGIDAPEKKQAFGKKSSKSVEVKYSKRDRYGRIIGKLIKDGQDIRSINFICARSSPNTCFGW